MIIKEKRKYAIATGNKYTTLAAQEILEQGGNAFDAIIAALWTATVSEPSLVSLAGGGFCLIKTNRGREELLDFFTQTPNNNKLDRVDFYPVQVDFGGAIQEFHIGTGAVATPGVVSGLFAIQRKFASLPMEILIKPAVHLARAGFVLDGFQALTFELLKPIFLATKESRKIFGKKEDVLREGDLLKNVDLANTMEFLAKNGLEEFYQGEIAEKIINLMQKEGGYLKREDLASYKTQIRKPLRTKFGDYNFITNPTPSAGGTLITIALKLAQEVNWGDIPYLSANYIAILTEIMRQVQNIRQLDFDKSIYKNNIGERLLSDDYLDNFKKQLRARINRLGSTTHMSIMDNQGNIASLTASNGEGSGVIIPGTGVILNNMLGEEDLNPRGFHQWVPNKRLSSMMAPSIIENEKITIVAGSAGSNRIRSAILQAILRMVKYNLDIEEAVNGPRIHFEKNKLDIEPTISQEVIEEIKERMSDEVNYWSDKSLFFGGANCVAYNKTTKKFSASGDERRDGFAISVN